MVAVSFNALIDVPGLILILIAASTFSYRKTAPAAFRGYLLFFVNYSTVIVFFKMMIETALSLPWI